MKLVLKICFILIFASSVYSQEKENNWHNDFDVAAKIAKKEKKPILIYFTGSDWCGPCKMLVEDFFDTERFKSLTQGNYVLYKADFPRNTDLITDKQAEDNSKLSKKYQRTSFPTVVIANFKGKVKAKRSGYNLLRDPSYYFNLLD